MSPSANSNQQRGRGCNQDYACASQQRDCAEPARVRMVCGDCCLPSCYVKDRVKMALEQQLDVSTSGEYAVVECTAAECPMGGQLHRECYEKLEERCLAVFSNVAGREKHPKPDAEKKRMVWKSGKRGGYYDRIRKLCTCACGRGVFKPLEAAPGHVLMRGQDGDATPGGEGTVEARNAPAPALALR